VEGAGHDDRLRGRGEVVPVVEAVLLAVVTIVTAWAGFSAADWSSDSRLDLARASRLRLEANRAVAAAEEQRNFDASTFDAWFIAFTLGRADKMAVAERRFRPEFKQAFDAWLATYPEHNPDAPPGPTFMPEYRQPEQLEAERLDRQADQAAADGDHAAASRTTNSGSAWCWRRCCSWSASARSSRCDGCAGDSPRCQESSSFWRSA
jgi:hypothetical protein